MGESGENYKVVLPYLLWILDNKKAFYFLPLEEKLEDLGLGYVLVSLSLFLFFILWHVIKLLLLNFPLRPYAMLIHNIIILCIMKQRDKVNGTGAVWWVVSVVGSFVLSSESHLLGYGFWNYR
jgi:hypothetical protein